MDKNRLRRGQMKFLQKGPHPDCRQGQVLNSLSAHGVGRSTGTHESVVSSQSPADSTPGRNSLISPSPSPEVLTAVPDVFTTMLPALVGFCGVLLGGILQVLAKHRAERYSHMMELRREVADLVAVVTGFAVAVVQSAVMIDGVRNDFKNRAEEDPDAEVELDQDYLERLGEEMFSRYRAAMEKSARLMVASDERVSDRVGDLQLKLADVINEIGYMHTGSIHIPQTRAKHIQADIMERVNIFGQHDHAEAVGAVHKLPVSQTRHRHPR